MVLKKIVLITTGQPSTNPRIVKEADALHAAGFEVTVLYCHFIDWATDADENLLRKVSWKHNMLGGTPFQNKILYFFTRMRFKFARLMNKWLGNKMLLAERAQARAYDELLKAAKNIKADWYVGHNLGALAIAVKAAKFNKAKAGFDFEDYHRGENDQIDKHELKRLVYLENKYVPQLNYISAASPLIEKRVAGHFPGQANNIFTLLNCFPLSQQPAFRKKSVDDNTLQLFWFSQTIGLNRGLETIIDAMVQLNDPTIHLTLAGRCNADFKAYLDLIATCVKEQIHFTGIIPPDALPAIAAKFDVGLALELQVPENRYICLTNKIFTYLLAGNSIILSETAMQLKFNNKYHVGESYMVNDAKALAEKIKLYQCKKKLNEQKWYNYELANTQLNWEKESEKLLVIIN